ncbi:MAG: hypothetical protein ACTHOU_16450, partial [Aureliella sp.]
MAKIELRNANIYLRDGLSGTAAIDATAPTASATTITYKASAVNTATPATIPVGARFTVASETTEQVHTVSAATATEITFTPALGAGAYAADDVITIMSRQVEIKVGDGNISWTESKNYEYELDRGDLDTVKEGDEAPVQVTLAFIYDFVRTGTSESITPSDALKGIGGAAAWVTSSADTCEPYAVDLDIEHIPPCSAL